MNNNNEKYFDDHIDDIMKETKELTLDDMEKITGGEILDPFSVTCLICEYIKTGKTKQRSFFFFSMTEYEYKCIHCGKTKWKFS
ncbi:MAG: hypothetical protein K5894_06685 [Lachnospiraceae bacterium]|nr:hypothetical protein [Lachnospiraceae bacterium]